MFLIDGLVKRYDSSVRETRRFEPKEKCSYLSAMIPDEFQTIREAVEYEIREKASRFRAIAFPVASREEAEDKLAEIRKRYHDATHYCFGYRILENGLIERSSDDREPSGTAGKPILHAIEKFKYHNICVVVIRWFGGTKLGTGGLARAYGEAANGALSTAVPRRCIVVYPVEVRFAHELTNGVMHTIAQFGANIHSQRYDEKAAVTVLLKKNDIESFTSSIAEATRGGARLTVGNERHIINMQVDLARGESLDKTSASSVEPARDKLTEP
jgi:uncharacterized YigZ family protein